MKTPRLLVCLAAAAFSLLLPAAHAQDAVRVDHNTRQPEELINLGSPNVTGVAKLPPTSYLGANWVYSSFLDSGAGTEKLQLAYSDDGINWSTTGALYGDPAGGVRDSSITCINGVYYVAYTAGNFGHVNYVSICSSTDLVNWTYVGNVSAAVPGLSVITTWAPEWFIDRDGSVYLYFSLIQGDYTNFYTYWVKATNLTLTSWTPAQPLGGAMATQDAIDVECVRDGDTYYLVYKNQGSGYIELAKGSSPTSFNQYRTGNWANWGTPHEGASLVHLGGQRWRIYFDYIAAPLNGSVVAYSDSFDGLNTWTAAAAAPGIPSHGTCLALNPTVANKNTPSTVAPLVPTTVQTGAYLAWPNEYVAVDASAGNVPVTLPGAPPDGTRVGVKLINVAGAYTATLTCQGTDVLNKAGGSATATLSQLNQAVIYQYKASAGIWYGTGSDLPLSDLDTRYASAAQGALAGTIAGAQVTGTAAPGQVPAATSATTAAWSSIANLPPASYLGANWVYSSFLESGVGTEQLQLAYSDDGINWSTTGALFSAPSGGVRDSSITCINGVYYVAYTAGVTGTVNYVSICSSTDLVHWTYLGNVSAAVPGISVITTWAPEWFIDRDGTVYLYFSLIQNDYTNFYTYWVKATNLTLTSWTAAQPLGGGMVTQDAIDVQCVRDGDTYYLVYKNQGSGYIELAKGSSPTAFNQYRTGNWANWGTPHEGASLVHLGGERWRIYFDYITAPINGSVVAYSDSFDGMSTWTAAAAAPGIPSQGTCLALNPATTNKNTPSTVAPLMPTAVQTAAYAASPNEYVAVDASAANVAVTLPSAPPDGTRVGVKLINVAGAYTATLTCQGTDVLNKASGSTSAALSQLNQGVIYQYKASAKIWYGTGSDLPLSDLDARYVQPNTAPAFTGEALNGPLTLGSGSGVVTLSTPNDNSLIITNPAATASFRLLPYYGDVYFDAYGNSGTMHFRPFTAGSAGAVDVFQLTTTGGNLNGKLTMAGDTLTAITYANRLVSPAVGTQQMFSDSTTQTWGAPISGGGTLPALGLYDGTSWTVIGK